MPSDPTRPPHPVMPPITAGLHEFHPAPSPGPSAHAPGALMTCTARAVRPRGAAMRGGPPVAVPQNRGTRPEADIPCSAMPARRMNRDEFFAKLSSLGEDALAKVLWNLYWRGSAALRERIEAELDPAVRDRRRREAAAPADPDLVLYEVSEFAELARAGAYIAGDRRVSPKERTQWRATFRGL